MNKDKNITPHNDKGLSHGYWEYYWSNGNLMYKGNYVNGEPYGYWEDYWYDGKLECKIFYII